MLTPDVNFSVHILRIIYVGRYQRVFPTAAWLLAACCLLRSAARCSHFSLLISTPVEIEVSDHGISSALSVPALMLSSSSSSSYTSYLSLSSVLYASLRPKRLESLYHEEAEPSVVQRLLQQQQQQRRCISTVDARLSLSLSRFLG
jgi:hypothetical protein